MNNIRNMDSFQIQHKLFDQYMELNQQKQFANHLYEFCNLSIYNLFDMLQMFVLLTLLKF